VLGADSGYWMLSYNHLRCNCTAFVLCVPEYESLSCKTSKTSCRIHLQNIWICIRLRYLKSFFETNIPFHFFLKLPFSLFFCIRKQLLKRLFDLKLVSMKKKRFNYLGAFYCAFLNSQLWSSSSNNCRTRIDIGQNCTEKKRKVFLFFNNYKNHKRLTSAADWSSSKRKALGAIFSSLTVKLKYKSK
jgi:hypothetical protein